MKRGDLAIIQGEVFKCVPAAPHLRDVPLIIKRLDCVDRRIFDLKVHECDTFMRFKGNPNIVSLFSYWSEKPQSPYQYKSLVCLFEEALIGDLLRSVVFNPVRPSNRIAMKYLCEISKGLSSLHNCNIIHGSVKPSSIYIQSDNTAMLGELGKVELDSAR
jgi:serine/threonine protein kinase